MSRFNCINKWTKWITPPPYSASEILHTCNSSWLFKSFRNSHYSTHWIMTMNQDFFQVNQSCSNVDYCVLTVFYAHGKRDGKTRRRDGTVIIRYIWCWRASPIKMGWERSKACQRSGLGSETDRFFHKNRSTINVYLLYTVATSQKWLQLTASPQHAQSSLSCLLLFPR